MALEDNKRIAKNTLFLYLRMGVTILVNLYTVRVLWKVLGVDDYGIYSVVGGIVAVFAILNNAMVSSSQRFISFELGRNDSIRLEQVFRGSSFVHSLISLAVIIVAETIGLWFVNCKLNIPYDRYVAANYVYQFSVASLVVSILSVPYNACIVAHEHMTIYGYFGILEVFLKLMVVFLLILLPGDKLIIYSSLIFAINIIMRAIYTLYCRKHFPECKSHQKKDYGLIREMFGFAGWSFLGNMGITLKEQGLNVILNLFFNVSVNAAKAISNQVNGAILAFVGYFQMALNPQITKRYASGEIKSMINLVFNGCKYSFILIIAMAVPLMSMSNYVLELWLDNVAPHTVRFMQLAIIICVIESVVGPITTALQATGKIKLFQIIISVIALSNLPIAYIWLRYSHNPYVVFYIAIFTSLIGVIARLILLQKQINFSYRNFFNSFLSRPMSCAVLYGTIIFYITNLIPDDMMFTTILNLIGIICYISLTYFVSLNKSEREIIRKLIFRK